MGCAKGGTGQIRPHDAARNCAARGRPHDRALLAGRGVVPGVPAGSSLGVIEYHSALRSYPRQGLQGINLDPQAFEQERRQHALYNWQSKYQNVRTELAASYLRALIAEKADQAPAGEDLNETLKELFRTFFPDKVYQGVRPLPNGSLEFPVEIEGGEATTSTTSAPARRRFCTAICGCETQHRSDL